MTLLFLFLIQNASADPFTPPPTNAPSVTTTNTPTTAPVTTEEFDPTVIEASGGFSGVTAVHVNADAGSLYSRKIDFTQKIRDSLSEMGELPARPGESP
jgi:hypothetical protein